MSQPKGFSNFYNTRHNLYVGWVVGAALRNGIPLEPVVDSDGLVTAELRLLLPDGIVITLLVPEPPEDWDLGSQMGDGTSRVSPPSKEGLEQA